MIKKYNLKKGFVEAIRFVEGNGEEILKKLGSGARLIHTLEYVPNLDKCVKISKLQIFDGRYLCWKFVEMNDYIVRIDDVEWEVVEQRHFLNQYKELK